MELFVCLHTKILHVKLNLDFKYYDFEDFELFFENEHWILRTKVGCYIDGVKELILDYGLYNLSYDEFFFEDLIYVSERYCENLEALKIKDVILFGNYKYADVLLKNNINIVLKGNKLISDFKFIYLNGQLYQGQQLKLHDLIEFLDYKFIYLDEYFLANFSDNNRRLIKQEIKYLSHLDDCSINLNSTFKQRYNYHKHKYRVSLPALNNSMRSSYGNGQALLMAFGIMLVSLLNCYLNIKKGSSLIEVLVMLLIPMLMCFSAIFFPYHQKRKNLRINSQKTKEYQNKCDEIFNELEKQIQKDYQNNLNYYHNLAAKLNDLIDNSCYYYLNHFDERFYNLYLGNYDLEDDFEIEIDNSSSYASNKINELKNKYARYKDIPLIVDLRKNSTLSFNCDLKKIALYLNNLMISLSLTYDYEDVKFALLVDENYDIDHLYLKEIKQLYFDKTRLIFKHKEELFKYADIENLFIFTTKKFDRQLMKNAFIFYFSDTMVFPLSDSLIKVDDNKALITNQFKKTNFILNYLKYFDKELLYKLRLYTKQQPEKQDCSLLKICNQGSLNHLQKFVKQPASIYACFGFDDKNSTIEYDISDQGIGPHMLVVGSSGSGKSNFVISFIIALAYRYTPSELTFAIVDYKGSGLEDALSYHNKLLPHICMSVNNIDEIDFDRSLSAFRIECKRREQLFRELSSISNTSILSLKDYINSDPLKYNLPKLANILIVIDEFAELKNAKADFLSEIISIARIGRSLGIYLLLATQKATAVVDDEIIANTNIKLALKLQNESESVAILNTNCAAKIKNVGEFYLKFNSQIVHGQSIYARAYVDKKQGSKVSLVDERLKPIDYRYFECANDEHVSSTIVAEIIAKNHNLAENIFNPRLEDKSFEELKFKYKTNKSQLLIGEYDDFMQMQQDALVLDLNTINSAIFIEHNNSDLINLIKLLIINNSKLKMILVANEKLKNVFSDYVEIIDMTLESDLNYLFDLALKRNDLLIVFAQYNFLINNDNRHYYEDRIETIIKHNHVIIIANNHNCFSLRFLNFVNLKFLSKAVNKDEILYLFGSYNQTSEDNLCLINERIVGFKYAKVMNLKRKVCAPIIRRIPDKITYYEDELKVFLGYDKLSRKKIYLHKNSKIKVISFYDDLLKKFYKMYHQNNCFELINYNDLKNENLNSFIWLGPKINQQYLFIPNKCKKLADDEFYLQQDDKGRVIKYINVKS